MEYLHDICSKFCIAVFVFCLLHKPSQHGMECNETREDEHRQGH